MLVPTQSSDIASTAIDGFDGPADLLIKEIRALLQPADDYGDVFARRAMSMISAVVMGLIDLRDGGFIRITAQAMREHLSLEQIEALAFDNRLHTEEARSVLLAYLGSLPHWKSSGERGHGPIHEEALRQHAYSQMYFSRQWH